MEENKEIVKIEEKETQEHGIIRSIQDMHSVSEIMIKSGLFKDVKSEAQAFVKILAGQELGIGAFSSMRNVFIIEGQTSLSAGLMSAKVKAHPKYDYRIKHLDDDGCIISFFEIINEETVHLGDSSFDKNDAKNAGLLGRSNYNKYPRNMYFSRAMSNGVRFYCPDIFYGNTVYTPEELNPDWTIEGSIVIEENDLNKTITTKTTAEKPQSKTIGNKRPYDPETLKARIATFAERHANANETATDGQRGLMVGLLNICYAGDGADMKRHEALQYLTGQASSKNMRGQYVLALLDWLKPEQDDGGQYKPDPMAVREAQALLTVARKEAGQMELGEQE